MSRAFEARYPGRCLACERSIAVGDLLRFDEDGTAIHADCLDAPPTASRRPPVVCDDCRLTKPCDCD